MEFYYKFRLLKSEQTLIDWILTKVWSVFSGRLTCVRKQPERSTASARFRTLRSKPSRLPSPPPIPSETADGTSQFREDSLGESHSGTLGMKVFLVVFYQIENDWRPCLSMSDTLQQQEIKSWCIVERITQDDAKNQTSFYIFFVCIVVIREHSISSLGEVTLYGWPPIWLVLIQPSSWILTSQTGGWPNSDTSLVVILPIKFTL